MPDQLPTLTPTGRLARSDPDMQYIPGSFMDRVMAAKHRRARIIARNPQAYATPEARMRLFFEAPHMPDPEPVPFTPHDFGNLDFTELEAYLKKC